MTVPKGIFRTESPGLPRDFRYGKSLRTAAGVRR